jgi:hypothetical protein
MKATGFLRVYEEDTHNDHPGGYQICSYRLINAGHLLKPIFLNPEHEILTCTSQNQMEKFDF